MKRTKKRNGFTLIELIIVIAILAILSAILVPSLINMLEDANNTVDMHNAKSFANAITYYYGLHPDKLQELIDVCATPGSLHCVQISVGKTNSAIHPILVEALKEAGYIESIGSSNTRYTEITCKSNVKWDGYYVVVQASAAGLTIAYCGHKVGNDGKMHSGHSWGYFYPASKDPTEFSSMMG